ncbi:MAG: hypothetical protein QOK25_468 [Thermoleophilaceae bacterium]|nr:hypothetical protein [Thermoleophilaceae bacterium]
MGAAHVRFPRLTTVRLTRLRPHAALLALLLAGVALRAFLMFDYRPAAIGNVDSARFLHFAHFGNGLFQDSFGPSGYVAFLKVVRAISGQLETTIVLQHLLGVVAALLLYAAVRRLGAPRWAALIPAAVVLLSGDQLYLEHALLSEAGFLPLATGGLYAAVRGLEPGPRRPAWLALAGALVAGAALFRNVGLVLAPVMALWAVGAVQGRVRERLLAGACVAATALAIVGGYALLASGSGRTAGISDVSGWNAYGRSAPFADCTKFTPPAGTRRLCQRSPKDRRPGSLFYLWFKGSPARAAYGHPPIGNATLGKFGRRAILAQPFDYVGIVLEELPRFVDPTADHRFFSGGGRFSIARRAPGVERHVEFEIRRDYSAASPHVGSIVKRLDEWQDTERVGNLIPAAFVVFGLLGMVAAPRGIRRGVALFGLAGGALVILPAATLTLIVRYTIPPTPIVAAAGALGAWGILERVRAVRQSRRA